MQRLSNVILYVVLLVFVVAASLALIAAAWLMTAHVLNGAVRPSLAKWLFISLMVMSLKETIAQKTVSGASMMIEKSIANGQTVKLPKSKAISNTTRSRSGSLVYNVSIDFSRINKVSSAPPFYTLGQSTVTDPVSPGETTLIQKVTNVSAALPPPFTRPNRIMFPLQLYYATSSFGNDPSLVAPLQLMQLENPVTFGNLSQLHYMRDRAEAWRTVTILVDFIK